MPEDYGLNQPGPEASPATWTAYRQAWSERAMAARRQHLQTLHSELRAKVRYADGERALAAFTQVLDAAGLDAWTAAHAQFKLESWDDSGFPEDGGLSEVEGRAASAWRDAIEAGRVELCDKAPFVSEEAFGLVDFLGRDPKETFEHVFPLLLLKA
jgi:hypothetical protein